MRKMLFGLAAVLIAACGSAGTNVRGDTGPGYSPKPTVPIPASATTPTLGDACLVGEWRETSGQAWWQLKTAEWPTYQLTGGAGSVLYIYPNGSVGWVFNGSAPYVFDGTDQTTGEAVNVSVTDTGSVTGTVHVGSGTYAGAPPNAMNAQLVADQDANYGSLDVINMINGGYATGSQDNYFVENVPLEDANGTYSCSGATLTLTNFFEPQTSTTFTKLGGI